MQISPVGPVPDLVPNPVPILALDPVPDHALDPPLSSINPVSQF